MSASQQEILRELERQERGIASAFIDAVRRILGAASARLVEGMILAGRTAFEIVDALRIGPAALSPLVEAVRTALKAGGDMEFRGMGAHVVVGFDMRNTVAERWLAEHGAALVTEIIADQEVALRTILTAGLEAGRGPRNVALDIIGRVDRTVGRRVGGIIGLTSQQTEFVANARNELLALDSHYFTRARRDKRFDSIVRRAIESGKPLSAADIDRIVGRYSDRLLAYRGEVIARTEALTALNTGRDQAWQQAVERGDIKAENITKQWKSASDARVRDTHAAMHNEKVGFYGAFQSPSGAQLRFPGDASLGAGADEIIQCRCIADYRVDWLAEELGG